MDAEIALVAYPRCQMAAIFGLTDVFRVAGEQAAILGSPDTPVRVSHWQLDEHDVVCTYDSRPGTAHRPTHVIFPPSLVEPEHMGSADTLRRWALGLRADGAVLGALCAGVFVLAETGVLDRRPATTHWAFADQFARRFPSVELDATRMVIDDGDVITAAGIMAWVDLGLSLVESLLGPTVMLRTSRFMIADAPRQHQMPYMDFKPPNTHTDEEVLRIQQRIQSELDRPLSIEDLARSVSLHPRTLQRRFSKATAMSVTEYIQAARLERVMQDLAVTDHTLERIAQSVGYTDTSTLRKLVRRSTGVTPAEYRRKFRTPSTRVAEASPTHA
ncbi:AraC family transcriptional regulator with amidase-like domain [Nocardia caishijiensis]|uniref:AraC family transcriptional regulator with amidase-like domain n=2 Tax=Nocardia caishijiensis TaxID=184756 RepID=A0ABQ6YHE8_9NOCA|nr:AraC family transcriptional regulator with amidase-like domain [Nocardia caishijiensis]